MQLYNWAQKAMTQDEETPGKAGRRIDMDAFRAHGLDKLNFASIFHDSAMNALFGSFSAQRRQGIDTSGGFDWAKLLAPEEDDKGRQYYRVKMGDEEQRIDVGTAQGQFIKRMRKAKEDQANHRFLVFGRSLVDELDAFGTQAYEEI